jgi:hypothetical protein
VQQLQRAHVRRCSCQSVCSSGTGACGRVRSLDTSAPRLLEMRGGRATEGDVTRK